MKHIGIKLSIIVAATAISATALARKAAPPVDREQRFVERILSSYDTDKDGRISDREAAAMRKDKKQKQSAQKAAVLQKYDANNNGALDAPEKARRKADHLAKLLPKFDVNKNGVLDAHELSAIKAGQKLTRIHRRFTVMVLRHDDNRDSKLARAELPAKGRGRAKRFDVMDSNRDGMIDRAEFRAHGLRVKAAKIDKRAHTQ